MEYYISVILIGVSAVLSSVIGLPMLKILQLSGYKTRGAVAWWKGTAYDVLVRYSALMLFGFITMIVYVACFSAYEYVRYCACAFYALFAVLFAVFAGKSGSCDVKFTGRIVRLFAVDIIIMLIFGAGIAWAAYYSVYCQTVTAALAVISPFAVILANWITSPFEKLNNKKYIKRAKRKLREKAPIVIGITGSYGKTTAKNLLSAMLVSKYSVLATPGSYNTPMGVCKTVNDILADERIFIAEMGARYKGDIKELCDIVTPGYGMITAVGDMHIETMGSRQNVADTKFELGAALPQDGFLILNGYNADCAALSERETACKKITVGTDTNCSFDALKFDADGTSFDMTLGGKTYRVCTKLLGAHIPQLVCVCAELASLLGVSAEDITASVNAAEPVQHRLQLIPSENRSVTVIDDAYNSNPVGAKNALDVLSCFGGKKVMITPGFVELGPIEKPSNIALGRQIAEVCDHAFLVGSRAADIKKGALECGMDESRIKIFDSRDAAVQALADIDGDKTVLFENDLPDNIK